MKTEMKTIGPRMKPRWIPPFLLAAGVLWLFAGEAQAQVGFAAEGRVGVTLPQGDLSDAGADAGLSIGAELQANFHRNLTAYLGLHRHAFGCDGDCVLGDSPRSSGLAAGLKYIFHSPGDAFVWGRGGLVANKLVNDDASGDRKIGFELGFGADVPIAERFYLVPNAGFVSHDTGGGSTARFFTLGVGAHFHFL